MALPQSTQKQVESLLTSFCEERIPPHVRNEIRLNFEIKGNNVTLYEERVNLWQSFKLPVTPRGKPANVLLSTLKRAALNTGKSPRPQEPAWTKMPIAQFRFDPKSKTWRLYCKYRDERWHEYINTTPTHSFQELVDEVEEDPTGIFWG